MLWGSVRRGSVFEVTPDLITVGGLTVDNVVAADGTVALDVAGGNGAFSAAGALNWVDRVGLVSCAVASYPKATIARLEAGGVDLSAVIWADAELSAGSWFLYDDAGRRDEGLTAPGHALGDAGFPTDRLSPAQIAAWRAVLHDQQHPDQIGYSEFRVHNPLRASQVPEPWRRTRGVHLAPSAPSVVLEMLDFFAGQGAVITADPGWQLAQGALDDLAPILARLDAFLPSEVELRALVPGAALTDALAALAARCSGVVAVKVGQKGAVIWDRQSGAPIEVPAEKVAARDPTGAGDSFCGGFLAGLVETGDPVQAARYGAISAAHTVVTFGAASALPDDKPAARAALKQEITPCL